MVILIGGASCSGKTTMAQHLLELHHITYMSIDHVKMGIIRSDSNCGFTACDPENKVTEHMWPIMREIIKTNIENNQNIIIEGCYIPVDAINDFEEEYRDFITLIYIIFSSEYIDQHFVDGIIDHRGEVEYKDVDDYMTKEYFIGAHELQKKRCDEQGARYFEVKTDYAKDLKSAYNYTAQFITDKKNHENFSCIS